MCEIRALYIYPVLLLKVEVQQLDIPRYIFL